jgi:hypothetical protein
MIDRCWREKVDGGVYLYLALVLGIAEAFFLLFICDVEFRRVVDSSGYIVYILSMR